jgi:hypothetical protein
MYAAVGTLSHQHGLERRTFVWYIRKKHEKLQSFTETVCTKLAGKILLNFFI